MPPAPFTPREWVDLQQKQSARRLSLMRRPRQADIVQQLIDAGLLPG